MNKDLIFDIEVYPNIFTCVIYSPEHDDYITFEVSERTNDFDEMCQTLVDFGKEKYRLVGFNNMGYDYPVLHHLLSLWKVRPHSDWQKVTRYAREKSESIINTDFNNRFAHLIWPNDQVVQQVDLMKIHHFDNVARATSLKAIEFNNRSSDIGDLPYDPTQDVPVGGFDKLIEYNKHDVYETFRFYQESAGAFKLREKLGKKYGRDFTNHNDGKIGRDIMVMKLEENEISCYEKIDGKKTPRQTKRKSIALSDVIFDYINFETRQFKAILKWFNNQTIRETKGVFTEVLFRKCQEILWFANKRRKKGKLANVNVIVGGQYRDITELKGRAYKSSIVGGLEYVFGTGGLHASLHASTWCSDDEYIILDVDVSSYYPWEAIANRIYPEHLGPEFCDIYEDLYNERLTYPKDKFPDENLSLKYALNVPYGDSNNKYSPFYDPKYTMAITINGQLSLCMLAESFMQIDDLNILQVNTDGITVRLKRKDRDLFNEKCKAWEKMTKLTLEEAVYDKIFIRDVNNYLAVYEGGGVKRKGKYEYDVGWHQNHSQKVVAKAVEAHLVHGKNVREFIENHDDEYDFYILGKCDRKSRLVLRTEEGDEELQRNNRYYASTNGGQLIKIMPPRAKKLTKKLLTDFKRLGAEFDKSELNEISDALEEIRFFDMDELRELGYNQAQLKAFELCQPQDREIGVTKESKVTVHNRIDKLTNVNYDYYVDEAMKLINVLNS